MKISPLIVCKHVYKWGPRHIQHEHSLFAGFLFNAFILAKYIKDLFFTQNCICRRQSCAVLLLHCFQNGRAPPAGQTMTVASSFEQRCPVLFVLHNTTLFLCFLIKWEMGNLLFYYWVKKPFKNPYFTKCAPLKTWCQTLEWHIVLLWLKVYCEFEHVVQKRSLSDGYLLLFKEKPYNKWIANHISLLNLAFWVHNK